MTKWPLREWRLGRGWTLEQMAARLGADPSSLARWERGGSRPQIDQAEKIVALTEGAVTLSDLVRTAGDKP